MTSQAKQMDRRTFVTQLPVVGATASVLISSSCASFRYATATEMDDRIIVQKTDFGTGDYVLVSTPRADRPLYVHRDSQGGFTAVLAECTHRRCQPEPVGERLVCPCHGSEFSSAGDVLEGPAERPLPRFEVESRPDELTIWWSRRSG